MWRRLLIEGGGVVYPKSHIFPPLSRLFAISFKVVCMYFSKILEVTNLLFLDLLLYHGVCDIYGFHVFNTALLNIKDTPINSTITPCRF